MIWQPETTSEWNEATWTQAIATSQPSGEALYSTRFIFQIAAQASEFYLGGNDSSFLVQLLSAPSDQGGDVDLMATILIPTEEGVHYCYKQSKSHTNQEEKSCFAAPKVEWVRRRIECGPGGN